MVVPHFFQSSPQSCGPTCLRMLFAAIGLTYDEGTIAQACGMNGTVRQTLAQVGHATESP